MMMRERDIDNEYMEKYYDGYMSLLSRGGLTVVSDPYFKFGKNMLNKVKNAFDTEALKKNQNAASKNGMKKVMDCSHL